MKKCLLAIVLTAVLLAGLFPAGLAAGETADLAKTQKESTEPGPTDGCSAGR